MELFGIYRRTCDDNNKVDLKKMTEVEWIKLAKMVISVAGCLKHGEKLLVPKNRGSFLTG